MQNFIQKNKKGKKKKGEASFYPKNTLEKSKPDCQLTLFSAWFLLMSLNLLCAGWTPCSTVCSSGRAVRRHTTETQGAGCSTSTSGDAEKAIAQRTPSFSAMWGAEKAIACHSSYPKGRWGRGRDGKGCRGCSILLYPILPYLGQDFTYPIPSQDLFTSLLDIIPLQCTDHKITIHFSQHSRAAKQTSMETLPQAP